MADSDNLTPEQIAALWDAYWGKSNQEDTWRMAFEFGREAERAKHQDATCSECGHLCPVLHGCEVEVS